MRVLVVNAGSATVKLSVLDGETEVFAHTVEGHDPAGALRQAGELPPVDAVGHRIVHGGPDFAAGVVVTDEVAARLEKLTDLAPLHNPPALAALAEARRLLPAVPHVAAFDTAFHRTIPARAATYPVPHAWTHDWGVHKYGFHGLSHAYCSRRAAELLGRTGDPDFRVVVAHLGGGCSLAAVRGGSSVDTTMGFTPLDGLMMGTRCGAIDPGVLIHVQRHHGLTVDQIEHALNAESGLLGVSGVSGDMREVERAAAAGDSRAALALDMFAYRVRTGVGAMAAALGGLDALVFTGGIGENAAALRARVTEPLAFLCLDPAAVLVVHTREDVTVAREVARALAP
jgi:acetate kinase